MPIYSPPSNVGGSPNDFDFIHGNSVFNSTQFFGLKRFVANNLITYSPNLVNVKFLTSTPTGQKIEFLKAGKYKLTASISPFLKTTADI